METIAVYWEPKIKIYSFKAVQDLALLTLDFQSERLAEWGSSLSQMDEIGFRFEQVFTQLKQGNVLQLYLLFERRWEQPLITHMQQVMGNDAGGTFRITSPVEMLCFFGPHFGERYGIAHAVYKALTPEAIPVLAASFSGSIIYLVLPEGMAEKAKVLLADTFEVP